MITENQMKNLKKGAILNSPDGTLYVFMTRFKEWVGDNEYNSHMAWWVRAQTLADYNPKKSIHDPALRFEEQKVMRSWSVLG